MKKWLVLTPVLVLIAVATGCGVTASTLNPGYASFERPSSSGLQRDTSLSLGRAAFRIAARFVDDDPEVQELLRVLDGVQVQVYRLAPGVDRLALEQDLGRAAQRLENADWQAIVQVSEPDTRVHILTRSAEERLLGVVVLVIDEEEMVFVNLMGDVEPAQLAGLIARASESDEDLLASLPLDIGGMSLR